MARWMLSSSSSVLARLFSAALSRIASWMSVIAERANHTCAVGVSSIRSATRARMYDASAYSRERGCRVLHSRSEISTACG